MWRTFVEMSYKFLLSLIRDSNIDSIVIRLQNEKLKLLKGFISVLFSGKVCLEEVYLKVCCLICTRKNVVENIRKDVLETFIKKKKL